jgi:ATP-dependent phosphofructokinase / diphosphate-dependent phosphofructokinase
MLSQEGLNIIGIPKTIDNDVWGTDVTFGFDSAVQIATEAIDRLHTTANSHQRVMIIEVMGHHAGWLALYSGMAGGGDIILIPELPFQHPVGLQKNRTPLRRQQALFHSCGSRRN